MEHEYYYLECEICKYWKEVKKYFIPCKHRDFYEEMINFKVKIK